MIAVFRNLPELLRMIPDEESAVLYFEKVRWGDKITSPYCPEAKVYRCSNGNYKCSVTKKTFNVRTNSFIESSKLPLRTWLIAIYHVLSHKKGVSSIWLAGELGVTQKTAWFVQQRIMETFSNEEFKPVAKGVVEVDESFVGGKNKNRHKDKKVKNSQGRSFKDKTPILGILERSESYIKEREHKVIKGRIVKEKVITKHSYVRCMKIKDTKSETIQPLIHKYVALGSHLMTDEWQAYTGLSSHYMHNIVDHSKKQYADGLNHTNSIENLWKPLKHTISGTHHWVSRKHIHRYSDMIAFRFNSRSIDISTRFLLTLQYGSRLKYQDLIKDVKA